MSSKIFLDRGERLDFAIKVSGYTRKDFAENVDISVNTIRSWIKPKSKYSNITEKKVDKILNALLKSGVICTKKWLLDGVGMAPLLTQNAKNFFEFNEKFSNYDFPEEMDSDSAILQEIQFFTKINKNAKVILITDDILYPNIFPMTYIGGIEKNLNQLPEKSENIIVLFKEDGTHFIGKMISENKINFKNNFNTLIFEKDKYSSFFEVIYIRLRG
ncbi:helix-turn-helix domain-containing protein [Thiotrichales bacterium 19X7-9]|nr:helix-turn-helix domain-containing protein [Thiotrichales bacterium 19X7-9]